MKPVTRDDAILASHPEIEAAIFKARYLDELGLSLSQLFKKISFDDRRFLAVAFTDQCSNQFLDRLESQFGSR